MTLVEKMTTKHPVAFVIAPVGRTVATLVAAGFIAGGLIMAIFGGESGALWFFSFCFALLAPLALIAAVTISVIRCIKCRRERFSNIGKK